MTVVVIAPSRCWRQSRRARYLGPEIAGGEHRARHWSLYGLLVQGLVACMAAAVLSATLGALWVAVEATTIPTTFLAGHRRTDKAFEASWKYVLTCSVGSGLAFLGTVLVYFAALNVPGHLTRAKVVDPSFPTWPALSVALGDTIVPDFPLADKSYSLYCAGNDL